MKKLALLWTFLCLPLPTVASELGGWTEQKFSLFFSNDWRQSQDRVDVLSEDAASMIWTALPEAKWNTRAASWSWSVETGVQPTALDRKGGDDRNLSLYFVFMPEAIARRNAGARIATLLKVKEARVLMYVWGGASRRGSVLASPYLGERGKSLILRGAETGTYSESVDLAADYANAFGSAATSLVGLAISADSDDTGGEIRAALQKLRLK